MENSLKNKTSPWDVILNGSMHWWSKFPEGICGKLSSKGFSLLDILILFILFSKKKGRSCLISLSSKELNGQLNASRTAIYMSLKKMKEMGLKKDDFERYDLTGLIEHLTFLFSEWKGEEPGAPEEPPEPIDDEGVKIEDNSLDERVSCKGSTMFNDTVQ